MRLLLLAMVSQTLLAQAPAVTNAKVETRGGANLEATFQAIVAAQESPAWVGYTVPAVPGNHEPGCWSDGVRRISPVMLEGSRTMVMLYRVVNHAVEKMRPVAAECELDGGGLPFILLTDVRPAESITMLRGMVAEKNNQALVMIAMHGDPAAVDALLDFGKSGKTVKVRGQALFWLAQRAQARETAAILDAVNHDPEVEVKKKAVFALSQIPNGEGVPKLIDVARNNKTPEVRKQAMFWLGQSKDPRAVSFFQEILTGR
jgi:HEAT repeats